MDRFSKIASAAELLRSSSLEQALECLRDDGIFSSSMASWALTAALEGSTTSVLPYAVPEDLLGMSAKLVLARSVAIAPWRALIIPLLRGVSALEVRGPSTQNSFLRLCVATLQTVGFRVEMSQQESREAFLERGASDVVLAYGSDETIALLASRTPKDTYFEGRGHGFGWILAGDSFVSEEVLGAATDIAAFDQFGCLSPRAVFHVGQNAGDFAEKLFHALELHVWSRAPLDPGTAVEIHSWTAAAALDGAKVYRGKHATVVFLSNANAPHWSLGARTIAVHACTNEQLEQWVSSPLVQCGTTCVGVVGSVPSVRVGNARVVSVGTMQTPLMLWGYEDPRPPVCQGKIKRR